MRAFRRLLLPRALSLATSLASIALVACSGDESAASSTTGAAASSGTGGGAAGCLPGELTLDDGSCEPAGIPPQRCREGFTADDARGCVAVLPTEPCPPGQMAIPGDARCREVAPCGEAPWGDIPVEASTQFVDAQASPVAADGTAAKPWPTIQQGIDAAADSGAIVAIAAGSYAESLDIALSPVRLWGRCPSLVAVQGAGGFDGLVVRGGADGAEVHDLAFDAPPRGVSVSGAMGVLLSRVWVHGTEGLGVQVVDELGPASLTVSDSLVEDAVALGIVAGGADLVVERSEVRGTSALEPSGDYGDGIWAVSSVSGTPSTLSVAASFVSANDRAGIHLDGADGSVEATVVRNHDPSDPTTIGRGINAQKGDPDADTSVSISGSLVEGTHGLGIVVIGAHATVADTVVRDTRRLGAIGGRGIEVEDDPEFDKRSNVEVSSSVIERSDEIGVHVSGSDAKLRGCIIRDTTPASDAGDRISRGLNAEADPVTNERANVEVVGSVLERNLALGAIALGSDALFDATVIRDTRPHAELGLGRGLTLQFSDETGALPTATVRACLVERSAEVGIAVLSGDVTVEKTTITDTAPRQSDQAYGDGIAVIGSDGPATVRVLGCTVQRSARAGITTFGAQINLASTILDCNPIALDAESYEGQMPLLQDDGGNECGCAPQTETCQVQSSALAPPPPVAN